MPLTLVTPPTKEPIELADAKHQCTQDLTITADDDKFTSIWIPAARIRAEKATSRPLLTSTWDWFLPGFPCWWALEVPKSPLRSVTFVKYVDTSGVLQTWDTSNYSVHAPGGDAPPRGLIIPNYNVYWPTTRCQWNAVQIRFVAGYGMSGVDVPALLRQAMLLDIGAMFVHREQIVIDPASEVVLELPGGSRDIYRSFKSRARYPLPED